MPVDSSRYALITNEYRYDEKVDSAIKSTWLLAREFEVQSAFSSVSAVSTLNQTLFDILKVPRRRFQVEIEGTDEIDLADFSTQTPAYTLKSARFGLSAGMTVIVVGIEIDTDRDRTILDVWG